MAMPDYHACITLLDKALDVADVGDNAYLLRTRLQRAIAACASALVDEGQHGDIRQQSRLVEDLSRHLLQPSEALDVRWRTRWGRLEGEIRTLRAALAALAKPSEMSSALEQDT